MAPSKASKESGTTAPASFSAAFLACATIIHHHALVDDLLPRECAGQLTLVSASGAHLQRLPEFSSILCWSKLQDIRDCATLLCCKVEAESYLSRLGLAARFGASMAKLDLALEQLGAGAADPGYHWLLDFALLQCSHLRQPQITQDHRCSFIRCTYCGQRLLKAQAPWHTPRCTFSYIGVSCQIYGYHALETTFAMCL